MDFRLKSCDFRKESNLPPLYRKIPCSDSNRRRIKRSNKAVMNIPFANPTIMTRTIAFPLNKIFDEFPPTEFEHPTIEQTLYQILVIFRDYRRWARLLYCITFVGRGSVASTIFGRDPPARVLRRSFTGAEQKICRPTAFLLRDLAVKEER